MELRFTAGIDRNQFKSDIDAMRRDILGLNNTVKSETSKMDSSFKNLSLGIAGYFSVNAVQGFVRELINIRGEFQKTEIAFTTMLGNADQAKSLMADMVELAAKTPFSLQDVSSGAKQLLAFQVPANEVVDTLTRLGNIAAGLSVPLSRINLVYGQVKAKGKLMGDDLRQFTEAGIPMVAELAKKFGTTTSEITAMVSAGKIGFKDVQDVLFSMTNEGGMFFNLMEKQSKSLSGQIANLGDSWDQMLNKIGESNEGILSDSIASINYLVQNYETVIEVIGVAVATYGAYRAALIATAALQQLSAGAAVQQALAQGTLTTAQAYGAAASVTFQRAQASLNATLLANPIGIVIGLVAGLTYVIYKNITATTQWQELQNSLNESTQKGINSAEEQRTKINSLIGVIKNKNVSDEQAKKALLEINKITGNRIDGLTIEGIRLGKNTNAISLYIEMLKKEARAKSLIESIAKAENNNREIDRDNPNNLTIGERFGNFDEWSDLYKGKTPQQRKAEVMLRDRIANNKAIKDGNIELQKLASEGVDITENFGKNEASAINSSGKEVSNAVKNKNQEVEKLYGEDTIKGLQQRISKLQEIIETSPVGGAKYNEAKAQKSVYEERLKKLTQTFDDEIKEIERQWKVRYALEEKYGKETAKEQFSGLKGDSYYADIKERFSKIDNKLQSGLTLSDEEIAQWEKLKSILDNLNGVKDPFTNYKENLESNLSTIDSSFERIKTLEKELYTMSDADIDSGKKSYLIEKIEAEKKAQKEKFQQLLEEQRSYEEKSSALQKEYEDVKNSDLYKNASDSDKGKIDDSFKDKFGALDAEMIKSTAEWQVAFGELEGMTNTSLQVILNRLLEFQAKTKGTLSLQDSAELQKAIDNVNNAANKNPFQKLTSNFSNYRTTLQASRKAQDDYNRVLKETPNDAKKVADAGAKMVEADKKAMEAKKKLVSQLQGGQDIFNAVGQGVMDLGDAFGGFDDATNDAIGNVMAIGNAAFDLGKSIASGDVAGMIKAGVQLIGSIGKALNGDQKKERQIKEWAEQVKNLKVQYQELERAIDKALGSDKYTAQQNVIANLEKQKILLQQMIQKEKDKKKTDNGKIDDWKQQISDINAQIDDLKKSIVDDILQIDVKGLADKIGDALIEGFGRGEDALVSLNKTADEVFRQMVKNALKLELEKRMQPIIDEMLKAMGYSNNDDALKAQIEALEKQKEALSGNAWSTLANANQITSINKLISDLKAKLGQTTGSFDGLTPEEREALKAQIIAATGDYQKAMEQYADLFGPDAANSPNGLKGDIKGMTEKTAGALESQINAIRIYQVESLNVAKRNQQIFLDALKYQAEIAYNTRPLFQIQKDIAELNSKVKKPLAGLDN